MKIKLLRLSYSSSLCVNAFERFSVRRFRSILLLDLQLALFYQFYFNDNEKLGFTHKQNKIGGKKHFPQKFCLKYENTRTLIIPKFMVALKISRKTIKKKKQNISHFSIYKP